MCRLAMFKAGQCTLGALLVLTACAQPPVRVEATHIPWTGSLDLVHLADGQAYQVTFLPDAAGHTYVTANGEVLSASGPPTARLVVSGGGLTRKDYFPALRVVADLCRDPNGIRLPRLRA